MAVQNHDTKRWDIYGTVTDVGQHRRYFIKTQSGRVLARNRPFIRRRVPTSIPATAHQEPEHNPSSHPHDVAPRRSARPSRPARCLIEEMNTFAFHVERDHIVALEAQGGGAVRTEHPYCIDRYCINVLLSVIVSLRNARIT